MRAGLRVGVGKFEQIWARVDKGGQVCIGQTDQVGMYDMVSGWVLVCVQSLGWVRGKFGQI